jgi:hypothetical protein
MFHTSTKTGESVKVQSKYVDRNDALLDIYRRTVEPGEFITLKRMAKEYAKTGAVRALKDVRLARGSLVDRMRSEDRSLGVSTQYIPLAPVLLTKRGLAFLKAGDLSFLEDDEELGRCVAGVRGWTGKAVGIYRAKRNPTGLPADDDRIAVARAIHTALSVNPTNLVPEATYLNYSGDAQSTLQSLMPSVKFPNPYPTGVVAIPATTADVIPAPLA